MAATDIITIILSFVNLGVAILVAIIAYQSLKALCGNLADAATALPSYHIPRRSYHPYTTGYIHYLRDPYTRPMVGAAYRPLCRVLDAETVGSLNGEHVLLAQQPLGVLQAIQERSGSG
ncbi:uncharacterized protein RCO7_04358 [Rhynchosporium graminicola]|uniref:Uncharacterized protein n=1 Tax=Rhynchosporium graminicola TaxID=2792576 RepID=A0A1E1L7X8_9HELO|nr:uncharacterized protein RCO7_04358 [Rhynchosporium commune]